MAKNQVVSIDIGTNAIKLVQLEQTASGLRLVSAGIELYPRTSATEEIDDQTIRQTLQKLWRKVQGRAHSVVLSIPRSLVTSRRLTNLPPVASDEQLPNLVAIQAETELPFRTDSAVYDYHDVRRTDKSLSVELIAAKRETVQTRLDYFNPLGIVPQAVIPSALATSVLAGIGARQASPLQGSNLPNPMTMVVDIGAGWTDLCLMRGNVLHFSRSFAMGGNQLTQRYQDEIDGNFEVAESQKIVSATLDPSPPSTGGTKGVPLVPPRGQGGGSDVPAPAEEWADRLVSELKRSISAAKRELNFDSEGGTTNGFVGEIWLCGGGARVAGLASYASEQLQIPTRLWNPFDAFKNVWNEKRSDVQAVADFSDTLAVAFGLGVNAFTHQVTLDLLPKEERVKLTQAEQRRKMLVSGVAAAILLVGLGVGGLTWSKTHQGKIDALDQQLESIGRAASKAKTALVEDLAIADLTTPRISPLDILREFSLHFADRIKIAWTSFNVSRLDEPDKAKITFNIEAQSHQEVSQMMSIMAQSGLFKDIKSGQVTSVGGERDKKLVFQTQVTCTLAPNAVQMFARARYLKPGQKLKSETESVARDRREWAEPGQANTSAAPSGPTGTNPTGNMDSNQSQRVPAMNAPVKADEASAKDARPQDDGSVRYADKTEFRRTIDKEAAKEVPVDRVEFRKDSDKGSAEGESDKTDTPKER